MPKAILVIGAAGGIGLEVAKALLGRDYRVVGTVLNDAEGAILQRDAPGVSESLRLDMADADDVARILGAFAARSGRIDGVVVCAGVSPYGPLETAALDILRRTLEVNTVSCLAVYQALAPSLRASQGRMILISSMAGKVGMPFIGAYVASKFALEGIADVMRREAFPFGVDVVLIEPGGVATSMGAGQLTGVIRDLDSLPDGPRALYGPLYDAYAARLTRNLPLARPPSDVADVIVEALEASEPLARYEVGADAAELCARSRTLSDQQFDETFREAWGAPLMRVP